ncbi:MAG: hypothetical protein IGS50_01990 [Synechococcales cyanobacterium C42_A2020_086]|nr:hypothetical protein [Synechococcales cyanobacterium C42_A2020_086]
MSRANEASGVHQHGGFGRFVNRVLSMGSRQRVLKQRTRNPEADTQ